MSRPELSSTQNGLAEHGLLSLVDDLLLIFIDHVDNHQDLCNLAVTCSRFQSLVEPYIWRSLLVLKGAHARQIAIALDSREVRIDYVQEVSIRYKDDYRDGIEELNHFLSLMKNLRSLTLESPCPNNSEWRTGVHFDGYSRIDFENLLARAIQPQPDLSLTLPALQSFTLHAHGPADRKFDLGRATAMFLHPTLRSITLSCLNFEAGTDFRNALFSGKAGTTALRSLTLIECNVDVRFLDLILSLPKALEELSIGERLHEFDDCKPSMDPKKRTSSPLLLTALQRQAKSLKRLSHIGGMITRSLARETDPEGAAKLRSLVNLETLELGFESHLYFYLRSNGFPPSLKNLKMLDAAITLNAGHDLRAMSDIAFRSIKTLVTDHLPPTLSPGFNIHLHFSDHSIFRLFVIAHPAEQNHLLSTLFLDRPAIYKIATILKSYQARFFISRETFPNGVGFIPPYMYGEELPVDELMYDSDDYWRFSGIDYRVIDDDKLRDELKGKKQLVTCSRCTTIGLSVDECRSLGNGSPCLPCRRARTECIWGDGENAEDETGEGQSATPQANFF